MQLKHVLLAPAAPIGRHLRSNACRVISTLVAYAAAIAISCTPGSPSSEKDENEESSIVLTVEHVAQRRDLGTVASPAGSRFVILSLRLKNNRSEPQPLEHARFSVETSAGLILLPSTTTGSTNKPCPASTSVAKGGSIECALAFEVADADAPVELLYLTTHDYSLSAEVSLPPCTWCGAWCADLQTDPAHCGACDQPVDSGQSCIDGIPRCVDPMLAFCSGSCVDLTVSAQHCGACDMPAGEGKTCVAGQPECANPSLADCGTYCADLTADDENCGSCGQSCPASGKCSSGGSHCRIVRNSSDETISCDELCGQDGYECVSGVAFYDSVSEPGDKTVSLACGDAAPFYHPTDSSWYYDQHSCTCSLEV